MKYVVANWKMKMNSRDILNWFTKWHEITLNEDFNNIEIIICPTFLHIPLVSELIRENKHLKVGAQDVSVYEKGAHTGDTGCFQLKEYVDYSIVGHSERNETKDNVIKKANNANENNIKTITCFVDNELAKKYQEFSKILAWEDPENISVNGQYRDKKPEDVENGISKIKELIKQDITLLYGGSVNRQNIQNLVNIERLDGVLVGNASLDPKHFLEIVLAYK